MKKNIEAFARYHAAKEQLAEYTQIGTAAIEFLKLNVSVKNGARLLGELVDACQISHWTIGKRFPDAVHKTTQIGSLLCRQVVVQQLAAFDLFSRNVVSDFARFSHWGRQNSRWLSHQHELVTLSPQGRWVASPCCYELPNKLGDLVDRVKELEKFLSWHPSTRLCSIQPLVDFARMCRNRVVHGDSIVGSDLDEFSKSHEFLAALKAYRNEYARRDLPKLPVFTRGHPIDLSPANAIFIGAVLYEYAREINEHVCSKMTVGEFVTMAFFYGTLVDTHPNRTIRHRDADARIKHFLASRYLYRPTSEIRDIAPYLKAPVSANSGLKLVDSTLWKIALERHEVLAALETGVA